MIFALAVVPAILLLLGFPIFVVLLSGSTVALIFFMNVPIAVVHQTMFGTVSSFALLAIPFFIYAGELMGRGSVAQRLVDVVQSGMGRTPGTLGLTTIGTSTIFGAISGSSAACVATIGRMMYPMMKKEGYPENFSAGLVTSVGAIGTIIPPSIPMIVFGISAQESVPRLYAAGIFPGLLIGGLLSIYVIYNARKHGFGGGERFNLKRFGKAFYRGIWALGMPFIVLGGIYGGVFSPTEAAAVAVVYAIIVTRFIFRDLSWADIMDATKATVALSAQIMIIVACATVFSWILTVNQVPAAMISFIEAFGLPNWGLLLLINLLLLAVGCFLDPIAAILMFTPLLMPLVTAAGVDGVHFGVMMTVNLSIGLFTPPFGMNIFVVQSVLGLSIKTVYKAIIPYVVIFIASLLLITYLPAISGLGVKLFFG